jgi:hypothetical protein
MKKAPTDRRPVVSYRLSAASAHGQQDGNKLMAATNPAQAINLVKRIEMMCDFLEHPLIIQAIENGVPVTMPCLPGALGFDVPLWVGLGMVGLWSALDAFSERAAIPRTRCTICDRICIRGRFGPYAHDNEKSILGELDDFRHLYAHNFAGETDAVYFNKQKRHVLKSGSTVQLTCGVQFNGQQVLLDLDQLRFYSKTVQQILERVS